MAKNDSESAAISGESIDYLHEVKKGKPRKFAMICKGPSVVSLVVYKKGNVEKHKKEAKQSGKGQFYFGMVDGRGAEMRFVLARSDGFESPPVKPTVLKGFLEESADIKCKPYFEIVDQSSLVLDGDDPLVARFLKLQASALQIGDAHPERATEINSLCVQIGNHFDQDQPDQAEPRIAELESLLQSLASTPPAAPPQSESASQPPTSSSQSPSTPQPDIAAQFKARLTGLLPKIKAAAGTPAGDEAKLRASEAGVYARKNDFDQANSLLDQIDALLENNTAPSGSPTPSNSNTDAQKAKLAEALKQLKPMIDKVIDANASRKGELFQTMALIASQIKQEEFDAAKTNILALGKQVKELLSSRPQTAPVDSDQPKRELEATQLRLEPLLHEACQADPEKRNALWNVWNYAVDQGGAANFKAAQAAFEKLEAAMGKILGTTTGNDGTQSQPNDSKLASALGAWKESRKNAIAQLSKLIIEFKKSNHPEADRGVVLLMAIIKNLTPRPAAAQQVAELVRYVETDDIIQAAETPNELGFNVSLRTPLLSALGELQKVFA